MACAPERSVILHRLLIAVVVSLLAFPPALDAQHYRFGEPDYTGAEIGRHGSATVVESDGPAITGRREFYGGVVPLGLKNRWIMVQDSTIGLVFSRPSGVKADLESYAADVYLRALNAVTAVEIRALAFSVWGEPTSYLGVTVLAERGPGEDWEFHPRWREVRESPQGHRTSIIWINRVMFEDESVWEADTEPVAAAWRFATGSEFTGLPEDELLRASGP